MPTLTTFLKYGTILGVLLMAVILLHTYQMGLSRDYGSGLKSSTINEKSFQQLGSAEETITTTTTTRTTLKPTISTTLTTTTPDYKTLLHTFINSERKKTILTYTKVFGDDFWYDVPIDFDFIEHDRRACEFKHCTVEYKRDAITHADIVLFHAADVPPAKELRLLRAKYKKQIWVWMTSESPQHYHNEKLNFKGYENLFDWSGTYRRDSRIWTPNFHILPLEPSDQRPKPNQDYASGKHKMVIAIISNNCKSYRIQFIKKLKKYINVDLYGKCKDEVDPSLDDCKIHSPECEALQSQYKFTLSLENAFCTDYITEKFYLNGLRRGNIPIVLNRANLSDHRIAPPNSYINILDFKDVKSLAEHLKVVGLDDQKYRDYHRWRQNYKIATKNRMCTTCEEIWRHEIATKIGKNKKKEVINPENFWDFETNCLPFDDNLFKKYLN